MNANGAAAREDRRPGKRKKVQPPPRGGRGASLRSLCSPPRAARLAPTHAHTQALNHVRHPDPTPLALTDATATNDSPVLVEVTDAQAPADSDPASGATEYEFYVPEDAHDGLDGVRVSPLAGDAPDIVDGRLTYSLLKVAFRQKRAR